MAQGGGPAYARTQQYSFASGELAPSLHARVDLSRYASGLKACRNMVIRVYGGVMNRPGTRLVANTKADGAARLVAFQFSTVQGYVLEFGNLYIRVHKDGGQVLYAAGGSVGLPVEIVTPYTLAELRELAFVQSADVLTIVHPAHPPAKLTRTAHDAWTLTVETFAPTVVTPADAGWTLAATDAGSPHLPATFGYVITYEDDSNQESLASAEKNAGNAALDATHYNDINITFPYPAGVVRANIYKYRSGTHGYIGSSDDGFFRDDGVAAKLDDTPPMARNPFVGAGNYPAAVTYYEQRTAFGGSDLKPDTVYLSQVGALENFSTSEPARDSDAITFTLASREVNKIWWLVGVGSLLIGTAGAIWRLDRSQNRLSRGLTPTLEGGVKKQRRVRCDRIPAIEAGDATIFSAGGGTEVRDLVYNAGSDNYEGSDLALLAKHLLVGHGVVEWAWAASPYSTLWAVRSDGVLLSLAYLREEQVTGWARHDTQGFYESVASVSEGSEDAVYVVVRRLASGTWRRFIERFATRTVKDIRDAYFVDCGLSLDFPIAITAFGLANPLTITAAGHGCSVGDPVDLDGVDGNPNGEAGADDLARHVNLRRYLVADVAGNVLTLANPDDVTDLVDASTWPAWISGGVLRRAVASVSGLSHLDGLGVSILADGSVVVPQVVSGGAVVLDPPASRVHVGLGYVSELETLSIGLPADPYGKRKVVKQAEVYVDGTRGLLVGPDRDNLETWRQREHEAWGEPTRPVSGPAELTVKSVWGKGGTLVVQQADPLPVEVLSIVPVFEVSS